MRGRAGVFALVLLVGLTLASCSSSGTTGATGPTARSTGTTAPSTTTPSPTATSTTAVPSTPGAPATSTLASVLDQAANLEGTSLATYQAIVAHLGPVTPFVNVVSSESQHLASVTAVAARHELTVPAGPFTAPAAPSSRSAACRLGVATERHVISTYDGLIPQVGAYPDVTHVLTTLRNAAQESHLPAFQHCA